MNNIGEVKLQNQPVRVCHSNKGSVNYICINDICSMFRREILLKDGTVSKRCPSARVIDTNEPKLLFTVISEIVELLKFIRQSSKMFSKTCKDLIGELETLSQPEIVEVEDVAEISEAPGYTTLCYGDSRFTLKTEDGRIMVNATEMARGFDKRPSVWLKLKDTIELRQELVAKGKFADMESQVITSRGSYGATWIEIHLWVSFAQWLSPAFAAWCNKKLVSLFQDGCVNLAEEETDESSYREFVNEVFDIPEESNLPVPVDYNEALTIIGHQHETISKQQKFINENKYKFEHYEETIESRECFSTTMVAHELGISAIRLNNFLMDQNIQVLKRDEWVLMPEYKHLQKCYYYEWFNHKTKFIHKFKMNRWTSEGRIFIIDLYKNSNE